jgi:hypothetical protein
MKPRSRCLLTLPLLLAAAPLAAQPAPSFPGVITGQIFGPDAKPLVVNGRVYVATMSGQILVYSRNGQ